MRGTTTTTTTSTTTSRCVPRPSRVGTRREECRRRRVGVVFGFSNSRVAERCQRGGATTTTRTRAYGESERDGTWKEKPLNAFGNLMNAARGRREVLQAGAPPLRDVAKEVDPKRIDDGDIQELISEMVSVCRARGVGLAAPQLGTRLRVIVLEDTVEGMSDVSEEERKLQKREPFAVKVIINPVLTPIGDLSASFFEGCLSVAGYRAVVRRHLRVRCQGFGADGSPVDFEATGWQARILQHELDHLNGVLYTDRMDSRTFRRVDLLKEALPGDHPEFGPATTLGESKTPANETRAAAVDAAEIRAKSARKKRRS